MSDLKIKISLFQKLRFAILRLLNHLLVMLALRKTRKFWGVIYDSQSKQPLDPVIVKLMYAHNGEPVQTSVTDLAGRYGFLARPGKFKIFAKKSNYSFPSTRVLGDHDGIFTDIYHGQFFELFDESEVVGPNIPMDMQQEDWNQQAKKKVYNTYPFFHLLVKKIVLVFFWFGFLSVLVYSARDFFSVNWIGFTNAQIVLFIYIALLFLNAVLPEVRLWGRCRDRQGKVLTGVSLELINPALKVVLAKSQSQADGRFLLRANPGWYFLRVKRNGMEGQAKIRVWSEGVVNFDIYCLVDK